MKNNTKIRLHLSKQLFESLTKQVLAEAKMSKEAMGGGAYTEMVKEKKSHTPKFDAYKQPKDQLPTEKRPKVTKAEKGSPEIKKANAERKIKEVDAVSYTNKAREIGEVNDRAETKKMEKMDEKMSSKEKMAKGLYKEEHLDEFMGDPSTSWEAIAAGMAAIGLAPLAIDKMHQWWEKKHPESFKKAQALSKHMDKTVGGNEPGQGHGVKTGKF